MSETVIEFNKVNLDQIINSNHEFNRLSEHVELTDGETIKKTWFFPEKENVSFLHL